MSLSPKEKCTSSWFGWTESPQSAFTMQDVEICGGFLAAHLFNFELYQKGEGGEEDEEGRRSRAGDREAAIGVRPPR